MLVRTLLLSVLALAIGCGSSVDAADPVTTDAGDSATTTCALAEHTTATEKTNPAGCAVLARDTSSCEAERKAQGLDGFWLKFSCRVKLTVAGDVVSAESDGRPDYHSNYFPKTDLCWESYTGAIQNPNTISAQSYVIQLARNPDTTSKTMAGTGIVGVALNGVAIFANFAAPGDDIFSESRTFDRCGAHPEMKGRYHYHAEPYAISYDDANFIGVMRDGYPIYGRRDADGSTPTLDAQGGHTGETADSAGKAVYHYHVNEQTSTHKDSAGMKQWFITTGTFHGTPAACSVCN